MVNFQSYYHVDDVFIDREYTKGQAILFAIEGELIFRFPAEMTDEQILHVSLRFASQAYKDGQKHGSEARAEEIRAALGVPHPVSTDAG